jgi:two-component system LytT family response regulator
MPLSFILIDENETSCAQLVKLATESTQIELIHVFTSIKEATKFLHEATVDFLIIDPNLSNQLGFSFIEKYQAKQPIIILSPRTKDAVKAYSIGVFDFILKPMEPFRFQKTIERLSNQSYLLEKKEIILPARYIEVRCDLMTERIEHEKIDFIEAMGDYVKIATPKRKYVVLMSMKKILELLPASNFFRSHKSYIINLQKVKNYNSNEINLKNKTIPLSRFRTKAFKELILSI